MFAKRGGRSASGSLASVMCTSWTRRKKTAWHCRYVLLSSIGRLVWKRLGGRGRVDLYRLDRGKDDNLPLQIELCERGRGGVM